MTHTTIREMHGEEMRQIMHWLPAYALSASPPLLDKAERDEELDLREGNTYLALFEEDKAVSCAASVPMIQQVRGKLFPMGGIFDVATHPAARRKGYSRQVLGQLLAAIRNDGRPLSCLYPFRESFYERLGYVNFQQTRKARFPPSLLVPLLEQDLAGEVDLVQIGEGYSAYRDYTFKLQQRIHGMAIFEKEDQVAIKRSRFWLALAKVNGEVCGLLNYDLKGNLPTDFKLRVIRFYHSTSQGKYLLLAWLARHVDQAGEIELWLPAFEHPETWLPDLRHSMEPAFFAPMGRVLDVAEIGGMQTGPGRFSACIADPLCPWNEGIWQFETVDGVLQVGPARQADCDLSIQGLTALVYGTQDPEDFTFRGWGDPSEELQAIMRAMFPPMQPYLHEYF